MHTETLLMYVLENNLLGTDIRPIPSSDNKLVILSTRDMCRVCEACLSKFSLQHPCVVASLEENDESWNREDLSQETLIKIPLDADNTNSAINAVYNFRLSELQIPQTTDLTKTTIIELDQTHILERFLSRRMQALLPFSKDKIRIYTESLSKPFNQLTPYRISNTKGTITLSLDPIYIVPLITNIDLHIIQGIRVHQLAFTELYKGKRNDAIEKMHLLHKCCSDKADNPITIFIDYLKPFRPEVSSSASALSSSVHSTSLDKKE